MPKFSNSRSRPPRIRLWHVAGIALFVASGGLLLYGYWPVLTGQDTEVGRDVEDLVDNAKARVEVIIVNLADFPLRAEATGRLAPWRRADISAEAGGLVLRRPVEEGQWVARGRLLLSLDDRNQRIELQEAESELLKAQAQFAVDTRSEGALAPADTTRLAQARAALKQAEDAFNNGSLTLGELQEVQRNFEAAAVLAGNQRSAVQAVTAGLAQAELRMERTRLALSRTQITAPFSGRVSDLEVEAGQHVGIGMKVLTLLEDDRMKVDVDVLEADLVRMRVGATARVRVPVLEGPDFIGAVYAINPSIKPETGTGRVTVALPNPDRRLITGLFAYIALETQLLTERLAVPADAVLVRQGRDLIFRVETGRAQWVYVTVGERSGDTVEIVEGLSPGDTVAVAGHFALAHDTAVETTVIREVISP